MKRSELVEYLNEYLRIEEVRDYGPQGLQVEGRDEVNKVVGMVDAHLPCVVQALEQGADLMLVHHGIFWGPAKPLRGSFGNLVRRIMAADLNLYAAHLALDAHPEVGNNAELARRLGLEILEWWGNVNGVALAVLAVEPNGAKLDYLVDRFEQLVGPVKLVQAHGPRIVHRVGIMSGGGARHIEEAAALGCDLFLTGETSHAQFYDALNSGINVIYGGHYTTEIAGVQALGRHLQEQFDLDFEFIDLPTDL
ncbi:MAG TPA: Nif3-like dinuclear metal center hexameric protein [Caldilineaceae bacterium]|nr:Nif3-like dinuclear metal center hexameric protein [Caldilineaceae bacterium]